MVPWEGGLGERWNNHTAGRAGRPAAPRINTGARTSGTAAWRGAKEAERASPRWLAHAQGGVEEAGSER